MNMGEDTCKQDAALWFYRRGEKRVYYYYTWILKLDLYILMEIYYSW
jgi:hypothetical protein